jgi:hypothetical protein
MDQNTPGTDHDIPDAPAYMSETANHPPPARALSQKKREETKETRTRTNEREPVVEGHDDERNRQTVTYVMTSRQKWHRPKGDVNRNCDRKHPTKQRNIRPT